MQIQIPYRPKYMPRLVLNSAHHAAYSHGRLSFKDGIYFHLMAITQQKLSVTSPAIVTGHFGLSAAYFQEWPFQGLYFQTYQSECGLFSRVAFFQGWLIFLAIRYCQDSACRLCLQGWSKITREPFIPPRTKTPPSSGLSVFFIKVVGTFSYGKSFLCAFGTPCGKRIWGGRQVQWMENLQ